jgi:bla regulator protein BlaR1
MNFLTEWISEELLKALGWTLVHSIWQLILSAAALWLVLKFAKKSTPALKYGIAVGTLVLSFTGVFGTFLFQWSHLASNPEYEFQNGNLFWPIQNQSAEELTWEAMLGKATFLIESNLPILVNFWFFGALLFLFRLANNLSEVRNLRKNAVLMEDFEVTEMVCRLAGKLEISRAVEIRTTAFTQSPLTFGTIRPVILLPAALIFHLSPAQLEAIIAHELAHVKRNDYLSNLILSVLEILFFFHPCYWWMSQTVKELRESAADDLALKAGIQPKVLATSLAEVLDFARQNSPELTLAASRKRNPTLLRIKRMLGYPTENYPQTPIISIPMLLTLFLSAGLMASAQHDAPDPSEAFKPISEITDVAVAYYPLDAPDTTAKNFPDPKTRDTVEIHGKPVMTFTMEDGKVYQVKGDLLISGKDTLVMSPKTKAAWENLRKMNTNEMPVLEMSDAPQFPDSLATPPIPPVPPVPPLPADFPEFPTPVPTENFMFNKLNMPMPPIHFSDTVKMTQEEKEKWVQKMEMKSKEWEAKFEKEFAPKMKEFEEKMKAWSEANEPKISEFHKKMQEWQDAQGSWIRELEGKMKIWQEEQGPKMKEFEDRMKEWEKRNQPKMEEFNRKMDVWQKEHRLKMEEFQKLLKEELKKEKN